MKSGDFDKCGELKENGESGKNSHIPFSGFAIFTNAYISGYKWVMVMIVLTFPVRTGLKCQLKCFNTALIKTVTAKTTAGDKWQFYSHLLLVKRTLKLKKFTQEFKFWHFHGSVHCFKKYSFASK